MIAYHLKRVFRPALWLVLAALTFVTVWVYRRGGGWTGAALGYSRVLQYWSSITPILLIGLIASTPAVLIPRTESDPLFLTRPSVSYALRDTLARFVALLVPVLLIGIVGSAFLSWRAGDAQYAHFNTPGVVDPLTVPIVWLVYVLGPFAGGAALIAIAECAGWYFRSNTVRIVVVGVVAFLDSINRLRTPVLSLSGTSLGVVQSALEQRGACPSSVIETAFGTFCARPALWGAYMYNATTGRGFEGPITADPASSLIISRVLLLLLAIGLMIGLSVLRTRSIGHARVTTADPQFAPEHS